MKLQTTRPEDRSRSGAESPVWADTQPACFRSEGFAEDLHESQPASAAASNGSAPASKHWWGDAALPSLSLALAGMMGVFAR
jgi:hypothetical protein